MIDGADPGGITDTTSWTGGGRFEIVHVSPRFGKLTGPYRPKFIRRHLATLAVKKKPFSVSAHGEER